MGVGNGEIHTFANGSSLASNWTMGQAEVMGGVDHNRQSLESWRMIPNPEHKGIAPMAGLPSNKRRSQMVDLTVPVRFRSLMYTPSFKLFIASEKKCLLFRLGEFDVK